MALPDLVAKLDASSVVGTFTGKLGASGSGLAAINVPVDPAALSGLDGQGHVDLGDLRATVGVAAQSFGPLLAKLPLASDVLGPLEVGLSLAESALSGEVLAALTTLSSKLEAELSGGQGGDLLATLRRIAAIWNSSPEGSSLGAVAQGVLGLSKVSWPVGAFSLANVVPALTGPSDAVGAMMALETVLAEAERLASVMATQVGEAELQRRVDALFAALVPHDASLADFISGLGPAPSAELDAAARALSEIGARLAELSGSLAQAWGFGEATLAYLNIEQTNAELGVAKGLLVAADLAPLAQALSAVSDPLAKLLARLDLSSLPSLDLAGLLDGAEARAEELASTIRTLDVVALASPVTGAVERIDQALGQVLSGLTSVVAAVQSALDDVKRVISALPIQPIAETLKSAMAPVASVMDAIRSLIAGIEAALQTAGEDTVQALNAVEALVDGFKVEVDTIFGHVRDLAQTLDIGAVVGKVSEEIQVIADAISRARLKPYFDTASGAISTTASVIGAVPFDLLPDSMLKDVDAALEPIRSVDANGVKVQLEGVLEIQDGKFELRAPIEGALLELQQKYADILAQVKAHSPHLYLQTVDAELDALKQKIAELVPQVRLEPVQDAIDRVKSFIAGLDLAKELEPIDAGFERVLEAIDQYSPERLLEEPERRLRDARERLLSVVRLRDWESALNQLSERALGELDRVNPDALEPRISAALFEFRVLLDSLPDVSPLRGLGLLLVTIGAARGLRLAPESFPAVLGWIRAGGGTASLELRAARTTDSLSAARTAVEALDPAALGQRVTSALEALSGAVQRLPDGSAARVTLETALAQIRVDLTLTPLIPLRAHYLESLSTALTQAETLRRIGFSEVDARALDLAATWAPLSPLADFGKAFAKRIGVPALTDGLGPALRALLAVMTEARLMAVVMPIFRALRERIAALLSGVLAPVQVGIVRLNQIADTFDLAPLRESLQGIYSVVRGDIELFKPSSLLAEPLAAFEALRAEVLAFDPLGEIRHILDAVREALDRIIDKLKATYLLQVPLEVYDSILAELEQLRIEGLLAPLLDSLDVVAQEVDAGLSETVQAFVALQQSLPTAGGAGATASASISVGAG